MTIEKLKCLLDERGVPENVYSLKGGLPSEAFCLGKNKDMWEVYYSEKGNKSMLKTFKSEHEACKYFFASLIEVLKQMELL